MKNIKQFITGSGYNTSAYKENKKYIWGMFDKKIDGWTYLLEVDTDKELYLKLTAMSNIDGCPVSITVEWENHIGYLSKYETKLKAICSKL